MPKKIDPEVEGRVKALSGLGLTLEVIVDTLKGDNIIISKSCVHNIVSGKGKRRQAKLQGLPSPVKVQPPKKVTTAMMRRLDLLTSRENPKSQRELARSLQVSQPHVCRLIKKLRKRVARKTRVHKLTSAHM